MPLTYLTRRFVVQVQAVRGCHSQSVRFHGPVGEKVGDVRARVQRAATLVKDTIELMSMYRREHGGGHEYHHGQRIECSIREGSQMTLDTLRERARLFKEVSLIVLGDLVSLQKIDVDRMLSRTRELIGMATKIVHGQDNVAGTLAHPPHTLPTPAPVLTLRARAYAATKEQQHLVAVIHSCMHYTPDPVLEKWAFRNARQSSRGIVLEEGEQQVWRPLYWYEREAERIRTTNRRTRDGHELYIRTDGFLVNRRETPVVPL